MIQLRRIRRRHHTLAYAALAGIVFALAIPAVLGSRGPKLEFSPGAILAATNERYVVSTPVPLMPAAGITLESGSLMLANAESRSVLNGEVILKMLVGGSARLTLENATIALAPPLRAIDEPLASIPTVSDEVAPLLGALLDARFEQLNLKHATVVVHRGDGSDTTLSDLDASIVGKRNGTIGAKGSFTFRGETVGFDVNLSLGDRSNTTRIPLRARLNSRLMQIVLPEARLSLSNGWQLSSQHATFDIPDLRGAARWFGLDWPAGPGLKEAMVEGTLDTASQTFAFQRARVEIDGNEANGTLLVNLNGQHPALEATLALQSLDITHYLPAAGGETAQTTVWSRLRKPDALSFPILRYFDVDLRLSANSIVAGGIVLGRSAATISLKAGKLVADLAEIDIDDTAHGNAQLSIDVSGATPRFTLRTWLDDIETAGLATALAGRNLVSGRGNLALDVSAAGDTLEPFLNTVGGKASLRLPRGGVIALDVPALLAGAQSKAADEVWAGATRGQTVVDRLEASLTLAQGVWTSQTVSARSGNAVITATGLVDTIASEVDVVVARTNASQPIDFSGTTVPASLAHVRGPLGAVRVLPGPRSRRASEVPVIGAPSERVLPRNPG